MYNKSYFIHRAKGAVKRPYIPLTEDVRYQINAFMEVVFKNMLSRILDMLESTILNVTNIMENNTTNSNSDKNSRLYN